MQMAALRKSEPPIGGELIGQTLSLRPSGSPRPMMSSATPEPQRVGRPGIPPDGNTAWLMRSSGESLLDRAARRHLRPGNWSTPGRAALFLPASTDQRS
jgi:hypothetical protein